MLNVGSSLFVQPASANPEDRALRAARVRARNGRRCEIEICEGITGLEIGGEFLAPASGMDAEVPEVNLTADYIVFAGRDQTLYLPDLEAQLRGYAIKRRWNAPIVSQGWSAVGGSAAGVSFADPADPATTVIWTPKTI